MPKIVYKCDYCCQTFLTTDEAEKHEVRCNYNPENKTCGSCGNEFWPHLATWTECKVVSLSEKSDYEEEKRGNCPHWTQRED